MKNLRHRHRRGARRGFTLLEILIVVGIIALLAAFVAPNLMGASERAKRKMATAAIESTGPIATALNLYRLDYGEYPDKLEKLTDPPELPGSSGKAKKETYIENPEKLMDPWGHEYVYTYPSTV